MSSAPGEERILVVAPTGKDGALLTQFLRHKEIISANFHTVEAAIADEGNGVGALLVADEALDARAIDALRTFRAGQPSWSDPPVLVMTRDGRAGDSWNKWLEVLGSVTFLERPVGKGPLLTALQSALRARSRQYEAREQLRTLQEFGDELKAANSRKDELLALVSHELRTPLTGVLGCAHLLARRNDLLSPADRETLLEDITEHGNRLRRVIENMLILSRAETAEEVNVEPVLIQRLLPSLVEELSPLKAGRTLEVDVPAGLAPIMANEVFLEQILRNLIRNSEKYAAPCRPVSLSASVEGGVACITVADRGAELTDEQVHRMFEAFYQDPERTSPGDGLGLGLPVCRRLAEVQGGSISAHPRREGGLEVTLRLPIAEAVFSE